MARFEMGRLEGNGDEANGPGQRKENLDELKGQASEREYATSEESGRRGGIAGSWESEWERQKESK